MNAQVGGLFRNRLDTAPVTRYGYVVRGYRDPRHAGCEQHQPRPLPMAETPDVDNRVSFPDRLTPMRGHSPKPARERSGQQPPPPRKLGGRGSPRPGTCRKVRVGVDSTTGGGGRRATANEASESPGVPGERNGSRPESQSREDPGVATMGEGKRRQVRPGQEIQETHCGGRQARGRYSPGPRRAPGDACPT